MTPSVRRAVRDPGALSLLTEVWLRQLVAHLVCAEELPMLAHGIASIRIGPLNPTILSSSTGERHRPDEYLTQLTFTSVRSEDLVAISIGGGTEAF